MVAARLFGNAGSLEESFIGLEIKDLDNFVEVGHLIRSHDACLVCAHFGENRKTSNLSDLMRKHTCLGIYGGEMMASVFTFFAD
jgi:Ni,Fe-hydrogenase I large subunit